MSDEIENFLRRVADRRRQQQQQRPAGRQPMQPASSEIVDADIVEAEVVSTKPLSSHVDSYIPSGKFAEKTSRLGEGIGMADENMDAHLHQAFDHKLGRLTDTSAHGEPEPEEIADTERPYEEEDNEGAFARRLIGMLRSPQSLRDAIILSEVFTRLENRW